MIDIIVQKKKQFPDPFIIQLNAVFLPTIPLSTGGNVPKISTVGRVLRHYPMNFYKLIPTCHTKLM